MKKLKLLTNPTQLSRAYLESLNDFDQSWEVKAEKFQTRRLRKLRQELA